MRRECSKKTGWEKEKKKRECKSKGQNGKRWGAEEQADDGKQREAGRADNIKEPRAGTPKRAWVGRRREAKKKERK